MNLKCPSCGEKASTFVGKIPTAYTFAGSIVPEPLDGGGLYECYACHLLYRYPKLAKERLDKLYRSGNDDNWRRNVEERNDWRLALEVIKAHVIEGKVLDVGCFDGSFLDSLSDSYQCFGIELHNEAAKRAKKKDINIIGSNFTEIHGFDNSFDLVTAFDVIEHVEDPLSFLKSIVNVTLPRGYIVISTGNTETWLWKLMKGRYGYCANAEHISFINPSWTACVAKRLGLEIVNQITFSYGKTELLTTIKQLSVYGVYFFAPQLFTKLRSAGYGGVKIRSLDLYDCPPPSASFPKDHFLTLFRKKNV